MAWESLFTNDGASTTGFTIQTNTATVESSGGLIRQYPTALYQAYIGGNFYTTETFNSGDDYLLEFDWYCAAGSAWHDDDGTDSMHYLSLIPATPSFSATHQKPNSASDLCRLRSSLSNTINVGSSSFSFTYTDNKNYAVKLHIENSTGTVYLWMDGALIGSGTFTPISNSHINWHWHSYGHAGTGSAQKYDNFIIYEYVTDEAMPRASLDQYYNLIGNVRRQILDQNYHFTDAVMASLVQVYGLRMQVVLHQLYGNASQYRAQLDQPYGDCVFLRRLFVQDYGDVSRYRAMFDQNWNMQEGLRQSFVQRYSIAEATYRAMCDQQYDLAELDLLRAQLEQLYVLAAGEALVQRADQSVVCDGVAHTSAYNIFIEQDEGLYYMVGELQLADELEYLQYTAHETEVVITVDGKEYNFIVDGYPRKGRDPGNNSFVVPLASPTILLQAPHSKGVTDDFVGMASVLVAGLAAPYTVDWQLVDWLIPDGVLTGDGEAPISIIKEIVAAAGGLVQTTPDGTMVCRPEYPVSVNTWSSTAVDVELTDQDDFFQIAPSPSVRDGYNIFYLSNQTLAADAVTMEVEKLSSYVAQVDVYQQPWDDTVRFNLGHSGGSWVSVIAEGVTIEEVTEQVEIIGGSGQTTSPVMAYVSHVYTEKDLGAVTVDEAGNVTAETLDNTLLQLTYKKQYWRFMATDLNIEDVQFYPEEVAV